MIEYEANMEYTIETDRETVGGVGGRFALRVRGESADAVSYASCYGSEVLP